MCQHLLLLLFIQILNDIYSIVGVHVVDELAGNQFGRQFIQQPLTVVLVHLHQYVGRCLIVKLAIYQTGIIHVKFIAQLGDVGGVHILQDGFQFYCILILNNFKNIIQKFLLHSSEYFDPEVGSGKLCVSCSLWFSGLALNHKCQFYEVFY